MTFQSQSRGFLLNNIKSFPRFFVVSFKVIQWKKDSFKPIAISNIPYRGYFGEKGGVQNIGSGNSFSIFVIIFFISTLMIFHWILAFANDFAQTTNKWFSVCNKNLLSKFLWILWFGTWWSYRIFWSSTLPSEETNHLSLPV